jgi:hypothetical protein
MNHLVASTLIPDDRDKEEMITVQVHNFLFYTIRTQLYVVHMQNDFPTMLPSDMQKKKKAL